jgi:hypothetical protein
MIRGPCACCDALDGRQHEDTEVSHFDLGYIVVLGEDFIAACPS